MVQESGNTFISCPKCSGSTRVYDSRGSGDQCIRRRRRCVDCRQRFSTYEVIAEDRPNTGLAVSVIGELSERLLGMTSLVRQARDALVLMHDLEKKEKGR